MRPLAPCLFSPTSQAPPLHLRGLCRPPRPPLPPPTPMLTLSLSLSTLTPLSLLASSPPPPRLHLPLLLCHSIHLRGLCRPPRPPLPSRGARRARGRGPIPQGREQGRIGVGIVDVSVWFGPRLYAKDRTILVSPPECKGLLPSLHLMASALPPLPLALRWRPGCSFSSAPPWGSATSAK